MEVTAPCAVAQQSEPGPNQATDPVLALHGLKPHSKHRGRDHRRKLTVLEVDVPMTAAGGDVRQRRCKEAGSLQPTRVNLQDPQHWETESEWSEEKQDDTAPAIASSPPHPRSSTTTTTSHVSHHDRPSSGRSPSGADHSRKPTDNQNQRIKRWCGTAFDLVAGPLVRTPASHTWLWPLQLQILRGVGMAQGLSPCHSRRETRTEAPLSQLHPWPRSGHCGHLEKSYRMGVLALSHK